MEVWSGKAAQDYNSIKIFGCPACYHIKEDKLDPKVNKELFLEFKRGVKGYKIWDPKDKKEQGYHIDSHQVKSKMTTKVSQQVESDATPHTLGSSVWFEIPPTMTQDENHIADEDTENTKNQWQVMGRVQDFVVAGPGRKNAHKLVWLTTNMVVA